MGKSLQVTSVAIMDNNDALLTEPAFSFGSLFVRVDILEKKGNLINIYEVKSKSIDGANINFVSGKSGTKIKSEWVSYLYDLAFQYYVLSNSDLLCDYTIVPHLILVDKSKVCAVDGMNQMFTVVRTEDGGKEVIIKPGIQRSDLDTSILKIIDVSSEIDGIINEYIFPTNCRDDLRFREFVGLASDFYTKNERIFVPSARECRVCQFVNRGSGVKRSTEWFPRVLE
ncbi:MAG: hypothetical protein IPG53_21250 [Ignavibacteriales bacterium]|nr:hypothetical protein [Ignavibacteriales bacterium]